MTGKQATIQQPLLSKRSACKNVSMATITLQQRKVFSMRSVLMLCARQVSGKLVELVRSWLVSE
jgi:hypothetical protein